MHGPVRSLPVLADDVEESVPPACSVSCCGNQTVRQQDVCVCCFCITEDSVTSGKYTVCMHSHKLQYLLPFPLFCGIAITLWSRYISVIDGSCVGHWMLSTSYLMG